MKWLAVHLPALSLQVYARGLQTALPLAVSDGERLIACNRSAQRQGVRPGLAESAGRALLADLRILPRDVNAEQAALERLAAWSLRFSDQVSLEPPRALVLEAARSLRLFGGAEALRRQVGEGITALGWCVRCVLAPTPAAALVLAAAGANGLVRDRDALRRVLAELPVAALGFDRHALDDLARMGLRQVGDLLRLPRGGFAERFGIERLYQLERLLGERADPRRPFEPPAHFSAALELPAEAQDAAALIFACRRLIEELGGFLLARQGGVQRLSWRLSHADLPPTRFRLGSARPERAPEHWLGLLRERLERLQMPAPVRSIVLVSETLRPLAATPTELFPNSRIASEPDPALLDRLRARLGNDAVRGLALVRDHRPERAWRWLDLEQVSADAGRRVAKGKAGQGTGPIQGDGVDTPNGGERPLWLLAEPQPLQVLERRPWLNGPLDLGSGCERIETGWWDDFEVARDYYVATTETGERLWIYRDMRGGRGWYLHGIFGL
jgi:protein ImuB